MKQHFFLNAMVMLGAGMAALLGGCLSGSIPDNPATPWVPPLKAQSSDTLWQDLRAQKRDFTNQLSLAAILDIALKNNPATRQTWNAARAASAQAAEVRGGLLPTVIGTVGAARQRTLTEPEMFERDSLRYGPGLSLDYLIINFGGGRAAAVEQALQTVYAANYRFNRSIQTVLLIVELAYYGLVSALSGIEAAEVTVADARAAQEASRERQAAGVGTELEVLQAQASYDQARFYLVNAKGQVKIAQGALARAMGLPADTTIAVLAPTNDVPPALTPQDLRLLIDDALARRPDIAELRAALAAQRAARQVAGAANWPSLYLTGNVSRSYYDTETSREFFQTQDADWSYGAGLALKWTLFDGFQTISAARAAAAQADVIQARLEQAQLAASAEVWNSYSAYETALERYAVSCSYLKSAAASYDLALASYKNGLSNILELLNTESSLAAARTQQIAARQDAFTAGANLSFAMGRLEHDNAAEPKDIFLIPAKKEQP